MTDMSSEQVSLLRDLADRLTSGEQVALDPGKEDDRKVIEEFLDLSNKRSDRYPALHKALASPAAEPENVQDVRIVDLGATRAGQATAHAWHGADGGSVVAGSAAVALDTESGEPLGFGSATRVGEVLTPAATDPETAKAATDSMTGLAFFHSQRTPDSPPSFGVGMTRRSGLLANSGFEPGVSAPKINVTGHTVIVIAVGRTSTNNCQGTDYCYVEKNQSILNPQLLVPFTGAASLEGPIAGVDGNHNISGLRVFTQVYSKNLYRKSEVSSLTSPITVPNPSAEPGKMVWDFKYDQLGQAETKSLKYEPVGSLEGANVPGYFYFEFEVPITGQGPFIFSVCSVDYPGTVSTRCKQIPNFEFTWHCLAAGTMVTMGDRSTLPIETVANGMRVWTGTGDGTLGVEGTQREWTEGDGIYEIATESGRRLTLTGEHPVLTPSGPLVARDLQAGATVMTEAGPENLTSVEAVKGGEMFVNLSLVDAEDRARGLSPAFGTFVANGILVGDHFAQMDHYQASRVNPDYMLERLPDDYHQDYESAIEDTIASR